MGEWLVLEGGEFVVRTQGVSDSEETLWECSLKRHSQVTQHLKSTFDRLQQLPMTDLPLFQLLSHL